MWIRRMRDCRARPGQRTTAVRGDVAPHDRARWNRVAAWGAGLARLGEVGLAGGVRRPPTAIFRIPDCLRGGRGDLPAPPSGLPGVGVVALAFLQL